jgi:hypothetical protein
MGLLVGANGPSPPGVVPLHYGHAGDLLVLTGARLWYTGARPAVCCLMVAPSPGQIRAFHPTLVMALMSQLRAAHYRSAASARRQKKRRASGANRPYLIITFTISGGLAAGWPGAAYIGYVDQWLGEAMSLI